MKRVYDEVRAAIKLGEDIFHRDAAAGVMSTDKSMQEYYSAWKEVKGLNEVSPLFLSIPPLPPSLSLPFSYVPPSLVSH